MLKYFTDSTIKSYMAKFAIETTVFNGYEGEEVGSSIRRVIDHWTIRGKFCSVHPGLKRRGIVSIEVGDTGFIFHREEKPTRKNIDQCEAEKGRLKGNSAYLKKDFAAAVTQYERALSREPQNIVLWSNLAAVMFELKAFKEVKFLHIDLLCQCIWMCQMAVRVGKDTKVDKEKIRKAEQRAQRASTALGMLKISKEEKVKGDRWYV